MGRIFAHEENDARTVAEETVRNRATVTMVPTAFPTAGPIETPPQFRRPFP
jgi:hypothetical protein